MKRGLLLIFASLLIACARLWNWQQIFVDGGIYFVDADCYSRMTRVAAVMAAPGTVLRHHEFENWPVGITPHTTILLDYLIAGIATLLRTFSDQFLDLAGAITPIVLAMASGYVLWKWAQPFRMRTQIAILFSFAVSPILVHGTVLGRPDHQSLLIFFIILALTSEWRMQFVTSKKLAIIHGLAWGFALWTSLFEPAFLLVTCVVFGIIASGKKWFTRSRAISALTTLIILLVALLIEHWRIQSLPSGPLFDRWSRGIGELAPVGWLSITYFRWMGLAIVGVPIFLAWQIVGEKKRLQILWLALLVSTYILSVYAARWGYFLGIAFIFTIPLFLERFRTRWIAALFFLGFWPVAREWDDRLWPTPSQEARLVEQREDYRQLRQIVTAISMDKGGIIAPWWLSPPIAYWSGAPCVAGSSHQSLPGIKDVADFYISRFPEKSHEILRLRQVKWVLAYEPDRVLSTASSLLEMPAAKNAFAFTLYQTPKRVPSFLQLVKETEFFKLYRVSDH